MAHVKDIFTYRGFYGDYGKLTVFTNGETVLDMACGGKHTTKRYKTLRGAKIALGRYSDSYTLRKVEYGHL